MPKTRVFADTNVILESFRTGCWTAISSHFAIETVQKCVEETLTGNPGDPRHVAVPPAELRAGLAGEHPVTRKEIAALVLAHPSCGTLDDGEKHLLAWLLANKLLPSAIVVVTTADKAALVASHGLGWLDCAVSLEDLARKAGVGRANLDALALQYREDWLSSIKTKIRMGILP
ncbi:hypothetical protein MW7_000440 [Imbroritus primus]|uniref:Uncharacterized protein n=1 Tax=Imbroritus primus TaxID=3058603 RepID=A0ACD3SW23_9BURK|nr:hypothetical protein MW7_000440 [Burkholderiaceae bacterium PBA]